MLLDQPLAFLLQPLQVPFGLLQRLPLAAHLRFSGIPGAALLAEPFLQIRLLLLQGTALLLQLLLLLAPTGVGCGQGLNSLLQPALLLLKGLALVPQTFDRQLPFALGLQQRVPFLAGAVQAAISRLQILLQLLPGAGIVMAVAVAFCGFQLVQFLLQWRQLLSDHRQPLLLTALLLRQPAQAFSPLPAAFQQGAMVAAGGIAFGHQGGLALFQLPQLRLLLLQGLGQL